VTTIWDRREALHQTRLAEASSPFQGPFPGAVTHLAGQGLSEHQAQGAIARQLVGQAYLLSATDIFWACGWISLGLIAFVWLARRPPAPTGPIAAD
jgi:DHA2 family multidrug resistance protein